MAELLVMLRSNSHSNPAKDQQGCYKKNDVVCVFEDNHEWGAEECPPTFQIVKVPGIPASDLYYLLDSGEYRRNFSFDLDAVQPMQLRALSDEPTEIVIEPEQLDTLITDKRA